METQLLNETVETTTAPETTTSADTTPESLGSWPDTWFFPYFESLTGADSFLLHFSDYLST